MKTLVHKTETPFRNNDLFIDRLFPGVYKLFTRPEDSPLTDNMKAPRVFIVDDDPMYLKALENSISDNHGSMMISSFRTGEACLQNLKLDPDIVILDYYLNAELPYAWNGISVLKHIKKICPKTKVIMISSQDSLSVAIDCMQKGAYDYISKSRSAFARINRVLKNITDEAEISSAFFQVSFFILMVVILALIAGFIIV